MRAPSPRYQFGPFTFDPERPQLLRDGEAVSLEPKALETLRVFLEHPGEVLDKATLMARIWPDVVVEESGLARNISLLRKALEDDPAAPRYLETVPRKGYRFVAELARREAPATEPPRGSRWAGMRKRYILALGLILGASGFVYWQFYRPSPHAPARTGRAKVAALPFTLEPGLEALHPGFLELLNAELAGQERFQAVSPDTVRRYQRTRIPAPLMGRMLGLDFLLEGHLHRAGDLICLTPRLVDVHSGQLVWSATHSYPADAFPHRRTEAARRIAQEAASRVH